MSGDIFLNIDRIVLHGVDHVEGKSLAAALKQSLLEQLAENPVRDPADTARVRTQISLPESFSAEQMGQSLAESLHGVVSGNGATREPGRSGKRGGRGNA